VGVGAVKIRVGSRWYDLKDAPLSGGGKVLVYCPKCEKYYDFGLIRGGACLNGHTLRRFKFLEERVRGRGGFRSRG